jgi:putative solute:sodium symporter small subunit
MAEQANDTRGAYWRKNLRITTALLAIWFVVTFVATFFARELSFAFFGWPFSFWMAAQGALLIYLALIGFYAWYMNRLDRAPASWEKKP